MPTGDSAATLKLEFARKAYEEVLDATKHQDDKIGRLLSAIAFLTAGALALANLGHDPLAVRFDVDPAVLPLVTLSIGTFLVSVLFTAILLVISLTTSLTLPGGRRPGQPSLLFFYSIAKQSRRQWSDSWDAFDSRTADELRRLACRTYLADAHNLAVRTNHKYARQTEAVGLLWFALLSFAVSVVLVLAVAEQPAPGAGAVRLNVLARLALAVVIGGFVFVHVLAARREALREVDAKAELPDTVFLVAATLVAAVPVVPRGVGACRLAAAVVASAAVVYGVAVRRSARTKDGPRRYAARRLTVPIGLSSAITVALLTDRFGWQLAGAVSVPLVLTVRGMLEATFADRRRRETYVTSLEAEAAGDD